VTTNAVPHLFWITSRAAGIVALVLASLAVSLGLLMSTKLLRGRGRGPDLIAVHEILSLSTIAAIVLHGVTLLGDQYLRLSVADIAVPFVSGYKTLWTSMGIIAGWGLTLLGLAYYARRRIGAARWRKLHRFTALLWLAGIAHSLGEGTDAGQIWFEAMLAIVAAPAIALLPVRLAGRRTGPSARRRARPEDPSVAARPRPTARPRSPARLQTGRVAHDEARELASAARPARPDLG
jgi:sulfoxide reductase heme-binding subunit YedZ